MDSTVATADTLTDAITTGVNINAGLKTVNGIGTTCTASVETIGNLPENIRQAQEILKNGEILSQYANAL